MKKYFHIAQKIYQSPWLITPQMHDTIRMVFEKHIAGDINTEPIEDNDQEVGAVDGIAVIPLFGIFGKHLDSLSLACGGLDVDEVTGDILDAQADPTVKSILLYIHSPGGEVTGVPELAATVSEVAQTKPVVAFTDSLMASAAYYIGSQASAIYSTPSSEVGSIGVYSIYTDATRYYEQKGLKVIPISAGADKLLGADFLSISDEQKQYLQSQIDKIYNDFVDAVASGRGIESNFIKDTIKARIYDGQDAVKIGLTDGLVRNVGEVFEMMKQMAT